jgi:hypothetical protein
MPQKPKQIGQLYQHEQHFKQWLDHAQLLNKANIIFQKSLPLQFIQHCQLANLRDHTLVVITDKGSYASLLRFHSQRLCRAVSDSLGLSFSELEVKVRPLQSNQRRQQASPVATLSKKTAALIQSTAADMADSPLKTALLKLARRQST